MLASTTEYSTIPPPDSGRPGTERCPGWISVNVTATTSCSVCAREGRPAHGFGKCAAAVGRGISGGACHCRGGHGRGGRVAAVRPGAAAGAGGGAGRRWRRRSPRGSRWRTSSRGASWSSALTGTGGRWRGSAAIRFCWPGSASRPSISSPSPATCLSTSPRAPVPRASRSSTVSTPRRPTRTAWTRACGAWRAPCGISRASGWMTTWCSTCRPWWSWSTSSAGSPSASTNRRPPPGRCREWSRSGVTASMARRPWRTRGHARGRRRLGPVTHQAAAHGAGCCGERDGLARSGA